MIDLIPCLCFVAMDVGIVQDAFDEVQGGAMGGEVKNPGCTVVTGWNQNW